MSKDLSMLIIDNDENYARELTAYAKSCGRFMDATYAGDGITGLEMLVQLRPDVVILESVMPHLDGIGFLRRLEGFEQIPVIIMSLQSKLPGIITTATSYGVDYFIVKPQLFEDICITAYELCNTSHKKTEPSYDGSLESKVTILLRNLGIPAHLRGYKYMRAAIVYTMENPYVLDPITKKLYPMIAEKYNTSGSSVERAIRHAIGVSWQRGNKKMIFEIFGYSRDNHAAQTPTNAEYIAMATDDFRLRLKHKLI